jgi:hypothetical protein
MVVVASGEPGVPVVSWALSDTAVNNENSEKTVSASRFRAWSGLLQAFKGVLIEAPFVGGNDCQTSSQDTG